jgi:mannose-6-phosphate isomerase-like protein (cupin superfamily)
MAIHTTSSNQLPISHESKNEWSEITPGERFSIRVSSEETNSVYTMLEIVADHRNGTPMHIDQNEDEHFIILEGTAHLACGDKTVDALAGTSISVSRASTMPGAIFQRRRSACWCFSRLEVSMKCSERPPRAATIT